MDDEKLTSNRKDAMPFPQRINSFAQITLWQDQLIAAVGHLSGRESLCAFCADIIPEDNADRAIACIEQVITDFKKLELKMIQHETKTGTSIE